MNFTDFDVLSFDCYGTLIDWEAGITAVLGPWARRHQPDLTDEDVLIAYFGYEAEVEAAFADMVYSDVLQEAFRRMGAALGFEVTDAEAAALGSSVGDWLAFPDSAEALARLKQHYRLIILSNVHREGFAASKKDAELPISRTLRTRGTRQKVGTQIVCARTSTCRVVVIAPDRRFRAPPCGRYGTAARSRSSGARGRGWPCGPAGELRLEGRGLTPPPTRHAGVLDDLRAGPGVRQSQTSAPLQVGEQG